MIRKLLPLFLLAAAPVFADGVDFNFASTLGDLGTSRTFTLGSFSTVANGFAGSATTDLWAKNEGPTEFGLGLRNGVDHEISGVDFVQLNFTSINMQNPTVLTLSLNSIQGSDSYSVWGSNTQGELGTLLAANQTSPTFNLLPYSSTYNFFGITSNGSVLIDDLQVSTPEPGTLLLLVAGLFGVFYFGKKFALSQKSLEHPLS